MRNSPALRHCLANVNLKIAKAGEWWEIVAVWGSSPDMVCTERGKSELSCYAEQAGAEFFDIFLRG